MRVSVEAQEDDSASRPPLSCILADGIKTAYFTTTMESEPSAPQARPSLQETSAPESANRDLGAESPPPVAGGPERRLAAGLRQTQPTGAQGVSTDRREPAANRWGAPPAATSEAGAALETADPVFQKALEILRREIPPPGQAQPAAAERQRGESPMSEVQCPTPGDESPESAVPAPSSEGAAPLRTSHSALLTQIIPARMLNEFVYCPRLFYYEFVESVFVESGDTLRGKALHRRVDSGKGELPPAAGKEEGRGRKSEDRGQKTEDGLALGAAPSTLNAQPSTDEVIHSRSVQMGSDRLGVTAKMDLVEVRAGMVSGGPARERRFRSPRWRFARWTTRRARRGPARMAMSFGTRTGCSLACRR